MFYLDNGLVDLQSNKADTQTLVKASGLTGGKLYKNDVSLWHRRLGHVPFARLSQVSGIKATQDKNDMDVCIACPLAKHTHLPFLASNKIRQEPFELIHVDIWGLVCSLSKYMYIILTIVDDRTTAT